MKQKTTRSDKTVIWVLSGACVLALIAVIVLLFVPMGTKTAAFTPPEFDPGAVAGEPEVPDDLGWSEIAIREGYKVKVCGVLNANADGQSPLVVLFRSGQRAVGKAAGPGRRGEHAGRDGTASSRRVCGAGAAQ